MSVLEVKWKGVTIYLVVGEMAHAVKMIALRVCMGGLGFWFATMSQIQDCDCGDYVYKLHTIKQPT